MADDSTSPIAEIKDLDQAKVRIALLEKKLNEAIDILLKRDDQLTAAQRRIRDLEEKLEERS